MSTLAVSDSDPVSTQAWERLFIAFGLSLVLHLALLLGIPVNPTGGMPLVTSKIYARLEPAASETPAEAAVEPPVPDVAPNVVTDKSVVTDPLADQVTKKPEPRQEPAPATPAPSPSPGIELPLIRDPTYYPASQLDVYPRPVADISRKCPPGAEASRVKGGVLILLLIDEFGMVNDASIVESEPEGYFDEHTLTLFRAARFYPAQRQGRAVKSRAPIRVRYLCDEVEASR